MPCCRRVFKPTLYFDNQILMSSVEFRKCITKVMIMITLFQRLSRQKLASVVEIKVRVGFENTFAKRTRSN